MQILECQYSSTRSNWGRNISVLKCRNIPLMTDSGILALLQFGSQCLPRRVTSMSQPPRRRVLSCRVIILTRQISEGRDHNEKGILDLSKIPTLMGTVSRLRSVPPTSRHILQHPALPRYGACLQLSWLGGMKGSAEATVLFVVRWIPSIGAVEDAILCYQL
ncbi:hypothetical protein B9Z19DRAFT_484107 [Tuber borchii]|uniref:Uncharacterized protein n=1 Tax=Tuber borchii TaxID=42251 RepID=A0A2T6ZF52_TUBBO|nr:hypothetical protein B9Z19DRAFT_484107 [Tuber borchii]